MLPVVLILVFLVMALVILIKLSKRAVEPQQPISQVSAVHCSLLVLLLLLLPSVASPPTAVMVSRTGFNSVLASWSAPSSAPAGYEVFYHVAGGSTLSGGNTSNTELTLTGLTLGNHSFFVVGYGAEGEPVLPSAHSDTATVIIGVRYVIVSIDPKLSFFSLDIPQLPSNPILTPGSTSIMVSWMQPPYSPSRYTVSYSCQLLCNSSSSTQGSVNVTTTTHTLSSLPPGSSCTISVVAVYDGIGMSNTVSSTTNTTTQGILHVC